MIANLLGWVLLPSLVLGAVVAWAPMPLADRYVLRKFSTLFFLSLLLQIALILVVRFGDRELGTLFAERQSLADGLRLFLYRAPERILEVIPASGILAAFFTVGSLTRSREIVAFKSVGVNLYRLAAPILAFTTACCLIAVLFVDRVVAPAIRQARLLDPTTTHASDREILFRESGGALCYIQTLDIPARRANFLTFYDFNDGELASETYAQSATWENDTWHLHRGWMRRYAPDETRFETFRRLDRPLEANPAVLVATASDPAEMNFAELNRIIGFKQKAGIPARAEVVRFQHNIAYPFALLVGVMLSLPLSMQFGRFAVVIGFPATMLISFLYWGLAIAIFEAMGENGRIPATLAPWVANIVFATVAVALFRGVRR
jgi:lipopolysaccharide export system permease protein